MEKYEAAAQLANDRSAGFVAEQAEAIKTLSALGREEETLRIFEERSKASPKRTRQLLLGAGGFAVSQAMVLFLSALIFYWGSRLLADSTISVNTL